MALRLQGQRLRWNRISTQIFPHSKSTICIPSDGMIGAYHICSDCQIKRVQ